MAIITKLGAAHAQLTTAIRMYFRDDDLASIHTLACAAREIYEKHFSGRGIDRMFDYVASANPEHSRKDLWDILNGPRNFLKHPSADLDLSASLALDDGINATTLFYACHDCAMLCDGNAPAEVQAFNMWFMATQFPEAADPDDPDAARASEIQAQLRAAYPGLRAAPLREEKRTGQLMIEQARAIAADTRNSSAQRGVGHQ